MASPVIIFGGILVHLAILFLFLRWAKTPNWIIMSIAGIPLGGFVVYMFARFGGDSGSASLFRGAQILNMTLITSSLLTTVVIVSRLTMNLLNSDNHRRRNA